MGEKMIKFNKKSIIKIPIYSLGAIGLYGMAGFYGVPYIITNIAPKKIEELTKSKICEIGKATFNPFSFELNLYNLKLTTQTNSKLATIGHINLQFNLISTIKDGKNFIDNILIDTPFIGIEKYENGEFNFTYLLALSKDEEKKEPSEPLKLHIESFKISNGEFSFDDQNENGKLFVDTKAFNFSILNLDTTQDFDKLTKINLASSIKATGLVDFQSNIALAINGSFDKKEIEAFTFNIKDLLLDVNSIGYKDSSPKKPFNTNIASIQVKSENFNSLLDRPFGADISLKKITLNEQSTNKNIFSLDEITADIKEVNLQKKNLLIDKITLLNPAFSLKRLLNGKIDLEDFIPRGKKEEKQVASSQKDTAWNYEISDIELQNGKFNIYDEVPKPKVAFLLDRFNFGIKGFSSDKTKNISLVLNTYLNKDSKIELKTDVKLSTMDLNGIFNVEKIDLPLFNPYIKDFTYIEPIRGKISTSGKFDYTNTLAFVDGKISLNDWIINNSRDNSVLFGWNKIGVTPFLYSQKNNALKIKQLNIDGLYTNVTLDKSKVLNFSTLTKNSDLTQNKKEDNNQTLASPNNPPKETANQFHFDLQKLYIQKSSANFSDESLPLPFKTYISNLNGTIENISSSTDVNATIALKGGVDDIGTATINGKVYVANPKDFAKVKVVFENLELKQYTPYSMEFLGYAIDDGRLFLNLDYNLNNKILQSSNIVSINQIKLGKEKAGGSPWPLGLAVAILEDSEGMIELDLPIEGNVDEPDFKYGKMVWKTIGNVFTKIVTSPFKMFSSLLGIESDKIEDIEFIHGDFVVTPSEMKKLDSVATILTKRKKLKLSVSGGFEPINDTKALKIKQLLQDASKLKMSDMEFDSIDGITLEIAENLAKTKLKNTDADKKELQLKYKEEKEFEKNYLVLLVNKLIQSEVVLESDLKTLANKRAKAITEYLSNKHQINDTLIEKEGEMKSVDEEKIKSKLILITR